MSIYRYSASAPVAEVHFRYASKRAPVALLTARANVDAVQLIALRRLMETKGFQCVPAFAEGRDVLQVNGFKREEEVTALLATNGFVDATPATILEAGNRPPKKVTNWLEHTSLRAAGWLSLIGDAGLLVTGILMTGMFDKTKKEAGAHDKIVAGALYTTGALTLARYGNVSNERQMHTLSQQMADFITAQSVAVPADSGLATAIKDERHGIVARAENMLYQHPGNVMLGAYTLGAATMLSAGIKSRNRLDIAYGVSSLATKTASLLIPEPKPGALRKKHNTMLGKVADWLMEKPLRLFATGSFVSDTIITLSAIDSHKKNKSGSAFQFITAGTYLMSDVLYMFSHKEAANNVKFEPDDHRRIVALAAETIASQPETQRAPLANQVGGFLSQHPEMKGNATAISQEISEQVKHLGRNPWAQRVVQPVAKQITSRLAPALATETTIPAHRQ